MEEIHKELVALNRELGQAQGLLEAIRTCEGNNLKPNTLQSIEKWLEEVQNRNSFV